MKHASSGKRIKRYSLAILTAALCACTGPGGPPGGPSFPIGPSGNGRYLIDRKGKPFFYHADAAWRMLWKASRAEADAYLVDRAKKGFTAVQVQLLPHRFLEMNAEKQNPFLVPGDLMTPNPAYLDHAVWFANRAGELGLLVALAPLWINRTDQDWHKVLTDSNAQVYGAVLGKRFRKCPNVIWVLGGGEDPGFLSGRVRILARALKKTAKSIPIAAAVGARPGSDLFGKDDWLDLDWISEPAAFRISATADSVKTRPLILGEGLLEGQASGSGLADLRGQAYKALLSGACGHAYGHRSIEEFNEDWKQALDAPGSRQMGYLKALFAPRPWHLLVPDTAGRFFRAALEPDSIQARACAAAASDGSFGLAYVRGTGAISVNAGAFAAPAVFRWFDPASGHFSDIGHLAEGSRKDLVPPGANADGDDDWVLVAERE
jgi:hypothetical protein